MSEHRETPAEALRRRDNLSFLESEYPPAPSDAAGFHIIPVPYERTVSYGHGTAAGPAAIIEASQQLEAFDGDGYPGERGLYTAPPIAIDGTPEAVMDRIADAVAASLAIAAIPVVLGGEHTVSYGAIRAVARDLGERPLGVIQIDAHADLRDRYEDNPWSHASVMRRVLDLGIPILQLGVRSLCAEDLDCRRQAPVTALDAREIHRGIRLTDRIPSDFPRDVYITFDVDGLDAAIMPATGTPEPGGLAFWTALDLIAEAVAGRRVAGLDVVELAPEPAHRHADYTAAKLTYLLMGIAAASRV